MLLLLLAGWLWVMVASQTAENTIYGKLGDEVTLKPDPDFVTSKTSRIKWEVGTDLAAEWLGGDVEYYRNFQGRGNLSNLTGEMKITGLLVSDSAVYTLEITNEPGTPSISDTPIRLIVISAVPKPTIDKFCQEGKSECRLTCNGNTTGAEPVTYRWTLDNVETNFSEKIYTITEESSEISEFSCKMKNPVSEESSDPFNLSPTTMNRKIITGVIVLLSLLAIVMLPVVFHRIRTGECFYEKDSMPWERDFWKKQQSNGKATTSPTVEEKVPMTES